MSRVDGVGRQSDGDGDCGRDVVVDAQYEPLTDEIPMDIADAFEGDVSPETFFLERLPELHGSRLELFDQYSETTLRFCIHLTDVDRRFCIELSGDGCRAIEGEFIEFPVATLQGKRSDWEAVRDRAETLFEKGRQALHERPPSNKITREFLDDFERYDGVVDVELGLEPGRDPVEMRLIFNDYDAVPGAPELGVDLSADLIERVLDGEIEPDEARESVGVSKDVGFAFELSGLLLNHFPELDSDR